MMKRLNGQEKRQFGRRQTCVHGWIKLRGRAPIPCTVLNISEGGALVEYRESVELPFRFNLGFDTNGPDITCEIRHQHQQKVGVEFVVAQVARPAERASSGELANWKNAGAGPARPPLR